jgi:signal transduction histidine kinase
MPAEGGRLGSEMRSYAVLLERWQTYWSWLFYGLLVVATGVAVADVESDDRRVAIVVLAASLAAWYWRAVVRDGRFALGGGSAAFLSLGVAAALWVSLLLLHWLFLLLMFSAYHLACSAPGPVRRALPRIAAVSAVVVVAESIRRGGVDPLQLVFYGAVTLALALFVAMMQAIHEQSEERRRLISELEATRAELAESERRAGVLAERQRLAREIHDTLAQGFASIVTLYEAARAEVASQPEVALRRLEEVGRTARASLAEARRVVSALRPEALEDATLANALHGLVRDFSAETGIGARSVINGDARELEPEAGATLLRIAQEGLANVRKHARAGRVALTLAYLEDSVRLDVRDDGVGFEPESGGRARNGWQAGGFGLTSMRERLESQGGTLTVESAPGAGTTVVAVLPHPPARPATDEACTPGRASAKSGAR